MRKDSTSLVVLFCLLSLVACAPLPQLEARNAANPEGVNLSGAWRIRVEGERSLAREGEQPQTIQMPPRSTSRSPQQQQRTQRRLPRSEGGDVWVFLDTGKALKVTQTPEGLFISFDRAVVEEITFGENRTVSVGPIEAQRVSGWAGAELVVETMDRHGAVLTETWCLEEGGSVLVRTITVTKGEEQLFSARQVFDPV